jgi:hypothetical protein
MHAKDLFVNNGCNWQTVEAVGKCLPQLNVVSSLALIVEAIYTIDGGTLVVTSEEEKVLWIFDLVGEKQADSFEALLAAVHIISKEEVVGIRWEPTIFKQSQQVIILTMYIATNLDGSF